MLEVLEDLKKRVSLCSTGAPDQQPVPQIFQKNYQGGPERCDVLVITQGTGKLQACLVLQEKAPGQRQAMSLCPRAEGGVAH